MLLIPHEGKKEQVKRHRPKYKSQYVQCCFCLYVLQFCSAGVSFLPGEVQNIIKCKKGINTFLYLDKTSLQYLHFTLLHLYFFILFSYFFRSFAILLGEIGIQTAVQKQIHQNKT